MIDIEYINKVLNKLVVSVPMPEDLRTTVNDIIIDLTARAKYKWHDLRSNPDDLPDDNICNFDWIECIMENHESDLPCYLNWDAASKTFGYWHDIFDHDSLGFVDSEFATLEDIGYEKVVAWRYFKPYEDE